MWYHTLTDIVMGIKIILIEVNIMICLDFITRFSRKDTGPWAQFFASLYLLFYSSVADLELWVGGEGGGGGFQDDKEGFQN